MYACVRMKHRQVVVLKVSSSMMVVTVRVSELGERAKMTHAVSSTRRLVRASLQPVASVYSTQPVVEVVHRDLSVTHSRGSVFRIQTAVVAHQTLSVTVSRVYVYLSEVDRGGMDAADESL